MADNTKPKQQFMFLGEAIAWIISRGDEMSSEETAHHWDVAERELFDFLAAGAIAAQGFPAPYSVQVYEDLPAGIWSMMNTGQSNLTFSPLDDSLQRHDGGSINVGPNRWDGVRLHTSEMLERWPTKSNESIANNNTDKADHKELWRLGSDWFKTQITKWQEGEERPTRSSIEKSLFDKFKIASPLARAIWADFAPPEWKKRGPHSKKN
ncbi:hypothetical protein [Phyllobacterium meliloti]|uniref:hypothetical protein n=1 Tax=Phyllobacterium meliloti TaxID=555317 RepID=UPI001D14CC2A|nr:hypothetical protein [Phyllobacterium sp. T1293]UGX86179.1 hypothetical protein LLE53_017410 [Phyllobacterium sp. T1293]